MSESILERNTISHLENNGWTYRKEIKDLESLEQNFKKHFENLNHVHLTENEFRRLLDKIQTSNVFEASKNLRQEFEYLERDDGTKAPYKLMNLKKWCQNEFEVVSQLRLNNKDSFQRYDILLLINGLPLGQIELKTTHREPKEALKQIVEYKKQKENAYSRRLMCFMQVFIASNGYTTYYFANNNEEHMKFDSKEEFLPVYQWAYRDNEKTKTLKDFVDSFLKKCFFAEVIVKYMVLIETKQQVLMMRPYQIYAVQDIVKCVEQNNTNGYVWHTTGSGKTLTSFKTATALKYMENVDKCLFVVDRKDLDKQTIEEFNKFQQGCVELTKNTDFLVKKLIDPHYDNKIIITTIQKLAKALTNKETINLLKPLQNKRMVFIFDECHRSQFGENQRLIREFFKNHQLFGFTGTPIEEINATQEFINADNQKQKYTTKDVFQHRLHQYTITNAIEDNNVLKFKIDYYENFNNLETKAKQILKIHESQTCGKFFNALFSTSRINEAIEYYQIFKDLQKDVDKDDPKYLNIACVFSPPNEPGNQNTLQEDLEQEKEDYKTNSEDKKKSLINIIKDYNQMYSTNFDLTNFDAYYQDIQKRIKDFSIHKDKLKKNRVDLAIVVDMLLTGFDSKYLNTIYVDKNLTYHGLVQAFSRTNRTLNSLKMHGNINDFRNQQDNVNKALMLYSGNDEKVMEMWTVDDYPAIKAKLKEKVKELQNVFVADGLEFVAGNANNLKGDESRMEFLKAFKEVRRLKNLIPQYRACATEAEMQELEQLIPQDDLLAFQGSYNVIYDRMKNQEFAFKEEAQKEQTATKQEEPPKEEFDGELVLIRTEIIDYDYIMGLFAEYIVKNPKYTKEKIISLLRADAKYKDDEDLVNFVNSLEHGEMIPKNEIEEMLKAFRDLKFSENIDKLIVNHSLDGKLKEMVDFMLKTGLYDYSKLDVFRGDRGFFDWARDKKIIEKDLIPLLNKKLGKTINGCPEDYK